MIVCHRSYTEILEIDLILGLMNDYNLTELKAEDLYFASDI